MPNPAVRTFEPEDVLDYQLISDAQISPNGELVVYVVETLDWEADSARTDIWVVSTAGGEPRRLTTSHGVNNTPRWSPDSKRVAFVSNRYGSLQLFVIPVDGGEAVQLTNMPNAAGAHAWSPDGATLAFTSEVPVEAPPDDQGAHTRWRHRPRVVTRALYKLDGVGFTLHANSQLFVVPSIGGLSKQLTTGDGNVFSPAWSPDGSRLVFSKSREGVLDSHCSDLWTIASDGGHLFRVTSTLETCTSPSWSPDGSMIAFIGNEVGYDAEQYAWVVPAAGGEPRNLTASLDRPIAFITLGSAPSPAWAKEGDSVFVLVADHGNHRLTKVCLDGEITYITGGSRQITLLTADDERRVFAFASCSTMAPRELFVFSPITGTELQVTNLNGEWNEGRAWPTEVGREFDGPNGPVYGRLLLPTDGSPAPHRILVDVHGGPHSQSLLSWEHHPYRFMLASRGWAVLMLDPRGSTSYGKEYGTSLRGQWGELDFPEFEVALDQLVEEGTADPKRLAIYGKSYGGFISAWSLGHTNRYMAAVVSAPVTNAESHFGASDTGYFVDPAEMGGSVHEQVEGYRRHSPVQYLQQCTTPALILHGEDDYRTPVGQSEELYHRLLAIGCETEMVLYPGGDHHVIETGRPSHRVDYNRRVIGWFERYIE